MDVEIQRASFFIEKRVHRWNDVLKPLILSNIIHPITNLFIKKSNITRSDSIVTDDDMKKSKRIEMILSKVSFHCKPASVTVLFGSGYENQKRLIECIALRQKEGYLSGKILYDSLQRKNGWFKDIVHISFNSNSQLSERYYSRLSVFEYLYYGARLRISHGEVECRERTRNAIKIIGLNSTAIVNELTSSEVRLLSIAVELIGFPSLLCLENPIDGLDASGSIEVMAALRKIAKRPSMPTTIIYVVKYLDHDMLRYIDNVVLFTQHKLVRFQPIHMLTLTIPSSPGSKEAVSILDEIQLIDDMKNLIVEASIQIKTFADVQSTMSKRRGYYGGKYGVSLVQAQDQVNGVLRRIAKDMEDVYKKIIVIKKANKRAQRTLSSSNEIEDSEDDDIFTRPSSYLANRGSEVEWNDFDDVFSRMSSNSSLYNSDSSYDDMESATMKKSNKTRVPEVIEHQFVPAHKRLGQRGQPVRGHKPIYVEILILVSRSWKHYMKNVILLRMYIIRLFVAGLLIGIFVRNNGQQVNNDTADDDNVFISDNGLVSSSVYNITSVMFMLASISIIGIAFAVTFLHTNMQIMKYEIASGLHHTISSWICGVLVDIPIYLLAAIILASVVWMFMGLTGSFFVYISSIILITFAGWSLALCVVVWSSTPDLAMLYFSIYGSFSILFTGYLQAIPDFDGLLQWVTTVSFSRWAFEALSIQAFKNNSDPNSQTYLDTLSFDESTSLCINWLISWCFFLQFIAIIGLFPPIYDTNFFKERYGNRVNKRLIQEAIEMDEDDVVIVEELERNTDRNRHAGSIVLASPFFVSINQVITTRRSSISNGVSNVADYGVSDNTEGKSNSRQRPSLVSKSKTAKLRSSATSGNMSTSLSSVETLGGYGLTHDSNYRIKQLESLKQVVLSFSRLKFVDNIQSVPILRSIGHNVTASNSNTLNDNLIDSMNMNANGVNSTNVMNITDSNSPNTIIFQGISGQLRAGQSCCILNAKSDKAGHVLLQQLFKYISIMVNKCQLGGYQSFTSNKGGLLGNINLTDMLGNPLKYCNTVYISHGDSGVFNSTGLVKSSEFASSLTVKEAITYAALLRCTDRTIYANKSSNTDEYINFDERSSKLGSQETNGKNVLDKIKSIGKYADIDERIQEVIVMMGLDIVANTIIKPANSTNEFTLDSSANSSLYTSAQKSSPIYGNYSRKTGLLPAQLRCLSIAMEIINRPSLIFLEDPFYGLDWFDCKTVSLAIQNLSYHGRTVLASLQRPRSSAVFGFDDLLMLGGEGLLLYAGKSVDAVDYFENGIGFYRRFDQGPLEFILDIANERGKLKPVPVSNVEKNSSADTLETSKTGMNDVNKNGVTPVSGSEGNSANKSHRISVASIVSKIIANKMKITSNVSKCLLSLEELALVCSEYQQSTENNISPVLSTSSSTSSINPDTNRLNSLSRSELSIIQYESDTKAYFPPLLSNIDVLLRRSYHIANRQKRKVLLYWLKYAIAGIIIGTIWWQLPEGDYLQRIGLLATAYCFICIVMVDLLDGIFERKEIFFRESRTGYSSYLAYWIVDSSVNQLVILIGTWLFVIPAYVMPKLRHGSGFGGYFYLMILASTFTNMALAYICALITPSARVCKMIFNGVIMPLQIFMSGYLILLSSLDPWIKWGAAINPMFYFLNGVFVNEFDGNPEALGTINYNDLKLLYEFNINKVEAFWGLIIIGAVYRLIWLLCLLSWDNFWRRHGMTSYSSLYSRLFQRILYRSNKDIGQSSKKTNISTNVSSTDVAGDSHSNSSVRSSFNSIFNSVSSSSSSSSSTTTHPSPGEAECKISEVEMNSPSNSIVLSSTTSPLPNTTAMYSANTGNNLVTDDGHSKGYIPPIVKLNASNEGKESNFGYTSHIIHNVLASNTMIAENHLMKVNIIK